MKKVLSTLSLLLAFIANVNAQQTSTGSFTQQNMSPNGIFDEVFDRFGTKYSLEDIRIDTRLDSNNTEKSALLCSRTKPMRYYYLRYGKCNGVANQYQ